ncbi:MAG: PD-(D/E)XK nuclease family protein [Pseudomonadota bacterium]
MPVTLITGPINSGKTTRMLEALSATKPGMNSRLIVPDALTATEFKRYFLAKSADCALKGDGIMDWHSFVRSITSATDPVLTQGQVTLAILDLLANTKLSYFGRAQKSFTLAAQFTSAILTLKSNCIYPTDLNEMIDSSKYPNRREADIFKIYSAYKNKLTKLGALDEGDLTSLAIEKISNGSNDLFLENETLLFDEFTNFLPGQVSLISAIKDALPKADIHISFPTNDLYGSYFEQGLISIRNLADREINLKPKNTQKPKAHVLIASSPAQEAREVAHILSGALNKNMCASDIVVASRPETTFMEWFLSEAHSMDLLPEHPTLDGATASPFIHKLLCGDSVQSLPANAHVDEYISLIEQIADVKGQVNSWIRKMKGQRGRGRVAARSLTAAAQLEETLKKIAVTTKFLGIKRMKREDFIKSFSNALEANIRLATHLNAVLPFRNVRLGTPMCICAKQVIIPRTIEGILPYINTDASFFSDWEDPTIRTCFPSTEDLHAREAYAFETLSAKCIDKIYLLMPSVNDQGSETLRSPFVDRFLDETGSPSPLPLSPFDSAQGRHLGRGHKGLDRIIEIETERRLGIDPLKSKNPSYMGLITEPLAKDTIRKRFTETELSTTALERYANCPFSFLVRYVLRIDELKEDEPEVHPLDRGNIVHEILRRFYKEHSHDVIAARSDKQIASKIDGVIRQLSKDVWQQSTKAVDNVSPGLRERQLADIQTMALQVVHAEIDEASHIEMPLMPKECEWSFGKKFGTELMIDVDGEPPAAIRGRIDRIDTTDDNKRFLVIDYKTGKTKSILQSIYDGQHLQLPLYISSVKTNLLPDAFALGGLMIEVKGMNHGESTNKTEGKTQGIVRKAFEGRCFRVGRAKSKIDDDEFEGAIERATAHAAKYIKAIRRGEFFARQDAVCDYCDNGDTCRYKKMAAD